MPTNYTDHVTYSTQAADVRDRLFSLAETRNAMADRHDRWEHDSHLVAIGDYTSETNRGIANAYEDCAHHLDEALDGAFEHDLVSALRKARVTFDYLADDNKRKMTDDSISDETEKHLAGAYMGYRTASRLLVSGIDCVEQTDK